MKLTRQILRKLTEADIREAIRQKGWFDRIDRLTSERNRLQKALGKVERNLQRLDDSVNETEVRHGRLGRRPKITKPVNGMKRRRGISKAGREAISRAQKARWAKIRGNNSEYAKSEAGQ